MMSRIITASLIAMLILVMLGCSGANSPVSPSQNSPEITAQAEPVENPDNHALWGLWQVVIDAQTANAEILPLRTAEWHVNALTFLEQKGKSTLLLKDIIIDGPSIELNVGLQHPFITLYQWSGFDVKGIFISDGSYNEFQYDGDITMSAADEPRLLNADGWTRWWNPVEFPFVNTILGYTDGLYGQKNSAIHFRNTLNPFKYFSDDLGQNQPFPSSLDLSRRGIFTAKSSPNWRHYSLNFGAVQNFYIFNYAVDACHKFADGEDGNSTPDPSTFPGWFPADANQEEPFAFEIEEMINTLYYASPTEFGGSLVLQAKIYDWQAIVNGTPTSDEILEVLLESPTLYGNNVVTGMLVPAGDPEDNFSTYRFDLMDAHPDSLLNQDILITVRSADGSYSTGYDGFSTNFTGSASETRSYFVYTPEVSPDIPVTTESIFVTSPNGGEKFVIGDVVPITWISAGGITFVQISYSPDGGTNWFPFDGGSGITQNDGTENWNTGTLTGGANYKIRIRDASDSDPADESDGPFSFDKITVTQPNGGETLFTTSPYDIKWTVTSGGTSVISNVNIYLSTDSGANYTTTLATNVPAIPSTWTWSTPTPTGTTMRIRVADVASPTVYHDESNADFTISNAPPSLTLPEYKSYFTGGPYTYKGQYNTTLGSLSQNYYNGTITNWDFTATPLSTYVGSSTFTVSFSNNPPRIAAAPAWVAAPLNETWGMRLSINGVANRRPWWVFGFDNTNNRLYYRGSTYYIDASFADLSGFGFCIDYVPADMTEMFNMSSTNLIQFPQDASSGFKTLGGSGVFYWVNVNNWTCAPYNDQWNVSYQSGSEWRVVATGSVKVPHSPTAYPNCLLVKIKANIGPTTQIVHTGQMMYQWIDMDTGMVLAFIQTHNEGNSTAGMPYYYGYSGDGVSLGVIGAWN